MSRAIAFTLAFLLAPLAFSAGASADGSSQALATPIGEGTHVGSVADGVDHWYRVSVPEGKAAHVAYAVVSGDDWNSLDFVDSTGALVASVWDDATGAYDPDEADAWIRVESYWGSMEYSFTLSFVNVPPQDDAGCGQDAGQRQETALAIQPGQVRGRVREAVGDVADWYRIDVPAGMILDVHSAEGAAVYLHSITGERIATVDDYDGYYSTRAYSMVAAGEPLFLRVEYGDPYRFVVDASAPADLLVDGVEVRDVEVETASGPAGVSYAREVLVTVANVGDGPSRKASLRVVSTHDGPATSSRVVGETALMLAAGERTTIAIPWDTTGQVGDVTLVASVTNEHDAMLGNNEAKAQAYVLASGLPMGLDLLNHEARAGGQTVRIEYGGERAGAATPLGFVGYDRGVLTLP